MPDLIVVVDTSHVREGKLGDLKTALEELVEFVATGEADPIAYNIYFDEDGTRMTVFQIHPNSASMETHMKAAGPVFRNLRPFLKLSRVDLYGKPSDAFSS